MTTTTLPSNTSQTQLRVPEVNLFDFRAKAAKLQAKAAKAGLPFSIAETGTEQEQVYRQDGLGYRVKVEGLFRTYFLFDVVTPEGALKLAGWELLGAIDYLPGGAPIIREVPGRTVPASYRDGSTFCEHCRTDRYRKQTFVVRHEDGRTARVGRNCLADFLGVDAKAILAAMEWLKTFRAAGDEDSLGGYGGRYADPTYAPLFVLTVAGRTIATSGYVSRKAADAMNAARGDNSQVPTTAQEVRLYTDALEGLLPTYTNRYGQTVNQNAEVLAKYGLTTDADKVQAEVVLAYAKSMNPRGTTYEYNLRTVADAEVITAKQLGILVSAFSGWKRTQEAAAATPAGVKRASQHVGTVGDRVTFAGVKVTGTRAFDGAYGPTTLVTFETPEGDVLKWFASGAKETSYPTGRVFDVVATVKSHDAYRDVKQTVVTRATATEVK